MCSNGCATFLKQMTSSGSWIRTSFFSVQTIWCLKYNFAKCIDVKIETAMKSSMLFRNYWLHCSFKATSCHKIYNDSHKRQELMKAIELYNNLFHVISDKLKLTMPNAFWEVAEQMSIGILLYHISHRNSAQSVRQQLLLLFFTQCKTQEQLHVESY